MHLLVDFGLLFSLCFFCLFVNFFPFIILVIFIFYLLLFSSTIDLCM
jgi:hypothetical protein